VPCFDLNSVRGYHAYDPIQSHPSPWMQRNQTTGQLTITPSNDGIIALSKDSCGVPLKILPDLWQSGYGPILNNVMANRELGAKLMTWVSSLA
jgi:hypothetical protein